MRACRKGSSWGGGGGIHVYVYIYTYIYIYIHIGEQANKPIFPVSFRVGCQAGLNECWWLSYQAWTDGDMTQVRTAVEGA